MQSGRLGEFRGIGPPSENDCHITLKMDKNIKTIIVDDEPGNVENLESLLKKHCPQVHVMATATQIWVAEQQIRTLKPDLLFLDIQMGNATGFDLLELLKERNFEVIFITAYDQYGIRAVKFSALDYLLKPVDIAELISAVQKAQKKIVQKQGSVQLNSLLDYLRQKDPKASKIALPQQQEIRFVPVMEIVRCEARNTYTYFFLNNGDNILVSKLLKEYDSLLAPCGFIRTHQSHLVNPAYVKSWLKEDGGSLLLEDGTKVPVSRPKREKVKLLLHS